MHLIRAATVRERNELDDPKASRTASHHDAPFMNHYTSNGALCIAYQCYRSTGGCTPVSVFGPVKAGCYCRLGSIPHLCRVSGHRRTATPASPEGRGLHPPPRKSPLRGDDFRSATEGYSPRSETTCRYRRAAGGSQTESRHNSQAARHHVRSVWLPDRSPAGFFLTPATTRRSWQTL